MLFKVSALFLVLATSAQAESLWGRGGSARAGASASCASCVLLSGAQTLTGAKTFSVGLEVSGPLQSGFGTGAGIYMDLTDAYGMIITGSGGDVWGLQVDAKGVGVAAELNGGTGVGSLALRATSGGSNRDAVEVTGDGTGAAIRIFPGSGSLAIAMAGTGTNRISSATSAASASATVGAFTFKPTVALDAADLVLDLQSSAAAHLFTVDQSGGVQASSTLTRGLITLSTGTGTATVLSGAICTCGLNTSAGTAAPKCSVAATTLTATGTGSDVISYVCL